MKPCRKCGATDRYTSGRCRKCHMANSAERRKDPKYRKAASERSKLWALANPDRKHKYDPKAKRASDLKIKYGLTVAEFDSMVDEQAGLCAICTIPMKPGKFTHVDHCHNSGQVRALLCNHCNVAIGQLKEDPVVASAAKTYLETILVRKS